MTPIEFAAWIRGVDIALNGAMPSKELWAEVVKQAQGVAPVAPAAPVAPQGPTPRSIFNPPQDSQPFDKRYASRPREFILGAGGAMCQEHR